MVLRSFMLLMLATLVPTPVSARPAVAQRIPDERILACAHAALLARSAGLPGKIEWVPVGSVAASQAPGGRYEIRAGEVRGTWPRRRVAVPVQVWGDGRMAQSRLVWFAVRWWREALAYTRAAKSGEAVDTASMQMQLVDALGVDTLSVADMAAAQGMRFRRPVRVGQAVAKGDFEPSPMVARNAKVRIAVEVGLVRLLTTGVAVEDGAADALIDVRPDGARRSVRARVVSGDEVLIGH